MPTEWTSATNEPISGVGYVVELAGSTIRWTCKGDPDRGVAALDREQSVDEFE